MTTAKKKSRPKAVKRGIGPEAHLNWAHCENGKPIRATYEYAIVSDQAVTDAGGIGPYEFVDVQAAPGRTDHWRMVAVLRINHYLSAADVEESEEPDTSTYHGGDIADEVACLASLLSGERLRATGRTRAFYPDGQRPLGFIQSEGFAVPPRSRRRYAWPWKRAVQFAEFDPGQLSTYVRLPPNVAVALARSARLYRDALWIAESEPELAWLFLVSAVESAANCWASGQKASLEDQLFELMPDLAKACEGAGGEEHVAVVARQLGGIIGATKKFVGFLLEHRPAAPTLRPARAARASWASDVLEETFRKIYKHRSKALHEGTPFPMLGCCSPFWHATWKAASEKPSAIALTSHGGTWSQDDVPIHLHVFAHIVRGAIVQWWKSQSSPVPNASSKGS